MRQSGQQRAETLAAKSGDVALGEFGEVKGGNFGKVLGAAIGTEHELDRVAPFAQILRQHLRAGKIGLAARGFRNGAVRAHQGGEKNLRLALARIAPADAQRLPARRRIDLDAGPLRELRQRIGVAHMDPMRAAVIGHAEGAGVGDATPADAVHRLDERHPAPGGGEPPRGRDAGGARPDDDDIDRPRGGDGAQSRAGPKRGRGGEKRSAAELLHG